MGHKTLIIRAAIDKYRMKCFEEKDRCALTGLAAAVATAATMRTAASRQCRARLLIELKLLGTAPYLARERGSFAKPHDCE